MSQSNIIVCGCLDFNMELFLNGLKVYPVKKLEYFTKIFQSLYSISSLCVTYGKLRVLI